MESITPSSIRPQTTSTTPAGKRPPPALKQNAVSADRISPSNDRTSAAEANTADTINRYPQTPKKQDWSRKQLFWYGMLGASVLIAVTFISEYFIAKALSNSIFNQDMAEAKNTLNSVQQA